MMSTPNMALEGPVLQTAALADPRWDEGVDHLVHALCEQRRSAMVLSEDPEAMDWVVLRLSRALRRQSAVQMEVVPLTSTDGLLDRFNTLLETLPVTVARHDVSAPLSLWVLRLRRELELPEVRLLLNLVQGFPGAGVRLLILCTREAAAQGSARFAATWGSRLFRWVIPAQDWAARPASWVGLEESPSDAANSALTPTPAQPGSTTGLPASAPIGRWQRWRAMPARVGAWFVRSRMHSPMPARAHRTQPSTRRWLLALGGVLVSFSGAAMTWLHTRADAQHLSSTPQRRPVPEIVEVLDDVRPAAVRQDQRS